MTVPAPAAGRRLRLGIVGCGRAATLHVSALAALSDWHVAALADADPEALARAAARVNPERTASDHRVLCDDASLDAIAVCVPAHTHAEVALDAIDAGRHVFVEKPLALTLADCDRIVERAERAGVRAMTGFNLRWHAQARRAREAIRRGDLGAIELVASRLTSFHDAFPGWQASRASGGGVLNELAIHHVDLWRWLTGAEVDEVFAYARSDACEDQSACLVARMSDGALATAAFGARTSRTHDLDVFGRRASASLSLYRFDGYSTADASAVAGDARSRVRAALTVARDLPRALADLRGGGAWSATYRGEWRHFAAAIRGETSVESTLDDGRRAVAVVLAALESTRTGRSVVVARAAP